MAMVTRRATVIVTIRPTPSPRAPSGICSNFAIDDDCDTVVDDVELAKQVGPLPYRKAVTAVESASFATFVLADFERPDDPHGCDGSELSWSSSFSLSVVDSVDGDDGDPTNGTCFPCEAMWSASAITLTFDPVALGGLPTHVGVVLTDASPPT